MLIRTRADLVKARVAAHNQLRAHLQLAHPGAVGLFHDLAGTVSLAFLDRFPTPRHTAWLSEKRLATWLRSARYTRSDTRTPAQLFDHLRQAPAGHPDGPAADAAQVITGELVALLRNLKERLAEIGDSRGRYPTDDALAAAAGISPSTRASGRSHYVAFRRGCNCRLRQALVDFADGSRAAHPWAQDTYARARARGHNHAHAIRILARAWLRIIWRCWTENTPTTPTATPPPSPPATSARHPPATTRWRPDQARRRFPIAAGTSRPKAVSRLAEGHPKGTGLDTDEDGGTLPAMGTTHPEIDMGLTRAGRRRRGAPAQRP